MNKKALTIVSIGLIIALGIVVFGGSGTTRPSSTTPIENVQVKEGIQYITIEARGGYTPQASTAQAGIPTKLIVKTNGTYDCSSALVIKSLNYQKFLPQNGEEVIDVGIPIAGEPLRGVCSMGMYSFIVTFV